MALTCRFCDTLLGTSMIDLGATPLANSFLPDTTEAIKAERRYPLHARVCGCCFLVQVENVVPPVQIFTNDYAYFSSFSEAWLLHAKEYAKDMFRRFDLGKDSLVVEVASNDGYLLRHFLDQGVRVLGIEPAGNTARTATELGIETKVMFFDEDSAEQLAAQGVKADLIAANNVLAHVPDIRHFTAGFAKILKSEAVLTFEFPHLVNLLEQLQFDTIYHEHYSYLSLLSVEKVLKAVGLRVFDVEELQTHGGSLRVFACHKQASHNSMDGLFRVRQREEDAGLHDLETYRNFSKKIAAVRGGFHSFLRKARRENASVAAYGAAAKGNTFLNYCNVTRRDIAFVVDRNPGKQNLLLPGSHIPVRAPEALLKEKPDYVIILPWNLFDEISASMSNIKDWRTRFVTAIPSIKITAQVPTKRDVDAVLGE